MEVLPQEKIGPYLSEAEKRGLLAAYYLELTTGLRRGELLALLWTDLDVGARTISVTKQVNRIKGELVVSQPKTQNSVRTLAIPQQAVDLLVEEHKKQRKTCTSEKHEKAVKISMGRGKSRPVLSNPFRSFPLMGHGLGHW